LAVPDFFADGLITLGGPWQCHSKKKKNGRVRRKKGCGFSHFDG
jgi:hypothetical protein